MGSFWAYTGILLLAGVLSLLLPPILRRITLHHASKRHSCASPPHLPAYDPIFNIDIITENLRAVKQKRRIKALYAQYQQYGRTFESWPFGRRVISTVDARIIQFVLATESEKFGVGPVRELAQVPMTGMGIITSDGEVWRRGRAMIKPTFTRGRIADRGAFERHVGRFFTLLPLDGKTTVDLQPLLDRLILDASSEFIFGESMDSLLMDECPIDSKMFLDSFSAAQRGVGARVVMGKMSFVLRDGKFWERCRVIREYTKRHVERALARKEKGVEDKSGKYVLAYEMAKETTDKDALCSQLLNVFFAGRDTPAVALSNVLFCLARHPEVWAKIRAEVEGLEKEDLTFERLKSLRYVQHSINEGLRLYPPVPNMSRGCLQQTMLPFGGGPDGSSPILVRPGDSISMGYYTLNRNPAVYGPDVEEYRPERWKDIRPNWDYVPFGGGARHCPAQQLALFWVAYTLVRMALEFKELQNRDPVMEYVENLKLNMESGNGVKVCLVRA